MWWWELAEPTQCAVSSRADFTLRSSSSIVIPHFNGVAPTEERTGGGAFRQAAAASGVSAGPAADRAPRQTRGSRNSAIANAPTLYSAPTTMSKT